jgi:hypothetical protein
MNREGARDAKFLKTIISLFFCFLGALSVFAVNALVFCMNSSGAPSGIPTCRD